jgi:hypothetical protein
MKFNWVFKLSICGMIGIKHKSLTIIYQKMNQYSSIIIGYHLDMDGSNVMSTLLSTTVGELLEVVGAFVMIVDSLYSRRNTLVKR